MPRRRAAAATSKMKKLAGQAWAAAASPEALKAALESQALEGGMVESPIDEAAMAVGKKKRSKKKTNASPIPPAPAPPEVSKLKVENSKSPISMAATTVAGKIKERCRRRRRRRRPVQTPPPEAAAPPKGEVGSGGSPGGKGEKKKGAVPIPPPSEVSKVKVESTKSTISMAATTVAGRINGTCRRRRRRSGQTPPLATAAPPPKGAVRSSRWLRRRGKKAAMAGFGGKKRWRGTSRNRRKATVCGGSNASTKRLSGKFKVIIRKRQARVPGIVGYRLVLQWPGGIEKLGKPLKKKFSSNEQWRLCLHGLWPLKKGRGDTHESISKNRNDYLHPKDLSSEVRKYLDAYFPSAIRGRSNIRFWGAEWLRHGKAAESKWKSSDTTNYKARYLMESVSIFLKYRQQIENALRGLQANMKDPEAHDIVHEIHREIGHLVKIQAVEREGCCYLYQIHLFLDASLLLQDFHAGSMNDKRLYATCNAGSQINIP